MVDVISEPLKVDVYTGDLLVLASGNVTVSENRPLKIIVQDLILTFNFEKNPDISKAQFKSRVENNNTLAITLYNFSNQFGEGLLEPLLVGTVNEKRIFISFWIATPNSLSEKRAINYTIYSGESTNV